jgi:GT2 family glycosyltransferase
MTTKASIIILTYNNLDYTRQCLDSIYEKTSHPEFELILVDNASQDGTPEFLEEFSQTHPNVRLVLNQTNEGFAGGNNLGAAAASGDAIVFLNNDIIVTHGWLSGLTAHLQDPGVGMAGPVTNASGNETYIHVDYQDLKDLEPFAQQYTQAHKGQAFEVRMLPFQCIAMRREVYEEVGPLDERFTRGMFEDDDYALRVWQKGYSILCAEDVFVHHWGSASFSRLDRLEFLKLFSENWKKFEEKWGTAWYPHQFRAEYMPEQLRQYVFDILRLTTQVAEKDAELEAIRKSSTWKLAQRIQGIRHRIAPPGSLRERLLRL